MDTTGSDYLNFDDTDFESDIDGPGDADDCGDAACCGEPADGIVNYDTDGNGIVDQTAFDTTGEGVSDTWYIDTSGDGVADQVAVGASALRPSRSTLARSRSFRSLTAAVSMVGLLRSA